MKTALILASAGLLAACGQASEGAAENNIAVAENAAAKKPKPRFCFFKEAETSDWAASLNKDGNVTVTGRAYRSDGRYKAVLGEAKVDGSSAEISPTIVINDTGFSAPENWWDVKAVIPGSQAVETVAVTCGPRTLATLSVRRTK